MIQSIKVLMIGDIIGKPGRLAIQKLLPRIVAKSDVDLVIANGENVAGGLGITIETARKIFSCGVDVITTGNHVWKHKKVYDYLDEEHRILRPANYPVQNPGRGWGVYTTSGGVKIGVLNLNGRVFMDPLNCPFSEADRAIKEMRTETSSIIVDFHAEASSEKQAMGWHLDGLVSLVAGTHTHVQTADERILPGGTGYITDIGMTGPMDSVIGMQRDAALLRLLYAMPSSMKPARKNIQLHGALARIDSGTGKCTGIERISRKLDSTHPDGDDSSDNP